MEEGSLPVVRAEVIQLIGETLFQALNQRLEEHQALFTTREKMKSFIVKGPQEKLFIPNEFVNCLSKN